MERIVALQRIVETTINSYISNRIRETEVDDALSFVRESLALKYSLILTLEDFTLIWERIRSNEISTLAALDIATELHFNLLLENFDPVELQENMLKSLTSLKHNSSVIDKTLSERMLTYKEYDALIKGNFWVVAMFLIAPVANRILRAFQTTTEDEKPK